MNKYQEALEHIIKCDREDCGMSYLSDAYRNDLSVLRELVDKATPKCVTDIHVDEFYCPNCGGEISHDYGCQLPNFCKECGQRLE